MKFKKDITHERQSLTLLERRELNIMRSQIVNLEAMLIQGIISRQDYQKELEDISSRVGALEDKYGIC